MGHAIDTGTSASYRVQRQAFPQVVATNGQDYYNGLSDGVQTGGTARVGHVATANIKALKLVYGNFYGNGGGTPHGQFDGPNAIGVKCAVEYKIGATAYFSRGFFAGGARTTSIDAGGQAETGWITVSISKGDTFWTRTYVSVTSGQKWPQGYLTQSTTRFSGGEGFAANSDVADSGAVTSNNTRVYSPFALLGLTDDGALVVLGIVGDSIANGSNDTGSDLGYIARAANAVSMSWQRLSQPGDSAFDWVPPAQREHRARLLPYCTHSVCDFGRNDLSAGRTLAQIQADLITSWNVNVAQGVKTWQTTITPKTTSTDGWATVANQTVTSDNTVRLNLNAWLRDGAPMSAGAAVATGTVGAARCAYYNSSGALVTAPSGAAHPLQGVFEVADLAESARDSGKWVVSTRVVTDAGIDTGVNAFLLNSATAAFTAADVGKGIVVAGAGAAGAALVTVITSRNSATQVVMQGGASTTVTNASLTIGTPTLDGLHPNPDIHRQMAAAVNTSLFTL